jgi:hypothetical protein
MEDILYSVEDGDLFYGVSLEEDWDVPYWVQFYRLKSRIFQNHDLDEAFEWIKKAYELDMDDARVHGQLAILYAKRRSIGKTLFFLDKFCGWSYAKDNKREAVDCLIAVEAPFRERGIALFRLASDFPYVLWAYKHGKVALGEEEKAILKEHLEEKDIVCVQCGERVKKVYRCAGCEVTVYCGHACQKKHWKDHKKSCRREKKSEKESKKKSEKKS